MDVVLAILIGLGLAAACGFRVFVPLAVLAIAANAGAVSLNPSLAWLGSTSAVIALSVASALEIAAYWCPWLDHALDTVATPAAVVAGTIAAASQWTFTGSQGDMLKWAAAVIAGGGVAGVIQAATVTTRVGSTSVSGGLLNPLLATVESGAAVVVSVLAVVVPIVVALLLVCLIAAAWLIISKRRAKRARLAAGEVIPSHPSLAPAMATAT
ncbi:MAG: DUF4126 domain-containing protein [Phycisphaerales bacterium]